MAHSFISSFVSEIDAFRAYARSFPERAVLLLDTYDTLKGAYYAVVVAKEMEAAGHHLVAVRLDSGDFADLSQQVRRILDEASLSYVKIVATGGLDEYEIDALVQGQAPIDSFGVGTKVGVSADAPWSDMAYKLVDYNGRPLMKLSADKASIPGAKQVMRLLDTNGKFLRDIIAQSEESLPGAEPLLQTVMSDGRRTAPAPTLDELHNNLANDLQRLDDQHKGLYNPPHYPVAISDQLQQLTRQVRSTIEES